MAQFPQFPNPKSQIPNLARRAFTLVELLIVVAIMVVLAALLIPAVRPALQDRKIREAGRLVNVFFTAAQARAIERGVPVGVWLERSPNEPNECIQLFMAEVPPPYSGDVVGARATLSSNNGGYGTTGTATFSDAGGTNNGTNSASLPNLVRKGDKIRFDYRGPYYTINFVPPAGTPPPFQITYSHPHAPHPRGTQGATYQIIRTPSRNSATTMALPSKTAINMYFSGTGAEGFGGWGAAAGDTTPVLIMFSPAGRLDRVYSRGPADPVGTFTGQPAIQSAYLLVNRNDNDNIAGPTDFANLDDLSNMWIAIGHNTGSVGTVDNGGTLGMPISTAAEQFAKVRESRRFAREKTTMGGR